MNDRSSEEEVLLVVHKHWASFFHDALYLLLPGVVALMLLGFVSSLPPTGVDPAIHVLVALLFPLCLLAVWIMIAILWTNYYLDMIIVTDRRIFSISQINLMKRIVLGWNIHDIRHVEARFENFFESLFQFGTIAVTVSGESEPALIEGVPNPEYVCAVILKQDDRYGALRDTARKQRDLLKFLSHEVKGHLTKSKAAFAAIVEGDYGPIAGPLDTMAHRALEDSQKGVDTVMSILEDADPARGTMKFDKKPFDLAAAVQRIAEELQPAAQHKRLSLVFAIKGPCIVEGDEEKVGREVVRNLIDNAIRYTPAGRIEVALETSAGSARLSVSDTGAGITAEDMRKLFTRGGHGAHSKDLNPESTGYGLFVAKQVVDAHDGRIWVESAGPGAGSRFFVELPLAPEHHV